jgi:hypothetical protein
MAAGPARFARNPGCRNRAGPASRAEIHYVLCFSPAYRAENCKRTIFILKLLANNSTKITSTAFKHYSK